MTGDSKFQAHCQSLVQKLTVDKRARFAKSQDDVERVRFLYPLAVELAIELSAWAPKDITRSEELKGFGNKLFQSRHFFHALSVYNEALSRCPQDFIGGQQLCAILIANRSAVFFEQKQFEDVLKDVELVKAHYANRHPAVYKLSIRAGKACEALKKNASARNYYKTALNEIVGLNEAEMKKQRLEIEDRLKVFSGMKCKDARGSVANHLGLSSKNITYPAISSKLMVKSSPELGRYVVAKEDIKAGEILAEEHPYVCVVNGDTCRTNCAFCLKSTQQLVVCEHCSQASYCSHICKGAADIFHKTECRILLSLFDTGASLNCLMAFRMITQRNLAEILAEAEELKKERNVVIYKSNDYYNVHRLVSHKGNRTCDELIHYTFMATYLLRLLKKTDYFGSIREDAILSDDEAYIGSLILQNLQILQFNAHEISELQNCTSRSARGDTHQNGTVGAGLYCTLSLFNHSCDPSLIRYNVGDVMVMRAIKHIKMNDMVNENYGPLYTNDNREARRQRMRELYGFECQCQPCVENWPQFQDINVNTLRVACTCGAVIIADKDLENPTLTCKRCKKNKNILPVLTGLIPLEAKSAKAEELYRNGSYKEAMEIIVTMLEIYAKYLAPPFTDMILLQQRLKSCLVHFGNKKFGYNNR